jgi:predicted nuclease of predicted toxin-antitoxin system
VKLLLDEMFPHAIAGELRRRGHDVSAITERPELLGKLDAEIFVVAQLEDRVIVTENVGDYRRLAAELIGRGHAHAGLILTTNRRFPRHDPRTVGRLVGALDELLSTQPTLTNVEHWLK